MINGQTLEQEVNEPKHYRSHESGIEAIEVTRYLEFSLGNCWKYLMRYRDKGTPKKDVKKSIWYIKDYCKFFVDYNNESMYKHAIPEDVITKMCKIEEAEPNSIIKAAFGQIIMLATQNRIFDRKIFDTVVYDLEKFAETLN